MTMNVNPYRLAARYHTFNVTFNPLTFLHNDPKISSKSLPTILTFLPKNLSEKNLLYSPRTRNPQPQLTLKILCCGEKNLCPSRAQIKERKNDSGKSVVASCPNNLPLVFTGLSPILFCTLIGPSCAGPLRGERRVCMCHLQAAWHAPLSTKKINKTPLRSGAASTDRRAFYVGPSVTGEGEKARDTRVGPRLCRPCPRARARKARFARASETDNV